LRISNETAIDPGNAVLRVERFVSKPVNGPRRKAAFLQADIERAIRATIKVGLKVSGLRVRPDEFHVLTGEAAPVEIDAFSEWKAKQGARGAERN
jgi:hypothetical protein